MEIYDDKVWQMTFGERAAFEGLLVGIAPRLAIEIGTAEGGSLSRIAMHAEEVHSFDLVLPSLDVADHVTLHTGDSHALLPQLLERFASEGRNVDFVLVDGDHSADGVRQDVEHLLNSDAVKRTSILLHDTTNEEVRRGLDAVRYRAWRKVSYVDLDFVPGAMMKLPEMRHELWGGLGLIVVDASKPATADTHVLQQRAYPAADLFVHARDSVVAREQAATAAASAPVDQSERVAELERELAQAHQRAEAEHIGRTRLEQSLSWRVTRPLRTAKRLAGRVRS